MITVSLIAILSLAKLYGKIELNLALAYALKIDAKSVKSIESILSKKLYLVAANNVVKSNVFNNLLRRMNLATQTHKHLASWGVKKYSYKIVS